MQMSPERLGENPFHMPVMNTKEEDVAVVVDAVSRGHAVLQGHTKLPARCAVSFSDMSARPEEPMP